jgi:hypothetical protein
VGDCFEYYAQMGALQAVKTSYEDLLSLLCVSLDKADVSFMAADDYQDRTSFPSKHWDLDHDSLLSALPPAPLKLAALLSLSLRHGVIDEDGAERDGLRELIDVDMPPLKAIRGGVTKTKLIINKQHTILIVDNIELSEAASAVHTMQMHSAGGVHHVLGRLKGLLGSRGRVLSNTTFLSAHTAAVRVGRTPRTRRGPNKKRQKDLELAFQAGFKQASEAVGDALYTALSREMMLPDSTGVTDPRLVGMYLTNSLRRNVSRLEGNSTFSRLTGLPKGMQAKDSEQKKKEDIKGG